MAVTVDAASGVILQTIVAIGVNKTSAHTINAAATGTVLLIESALEGGQNDNLVSYSVMTEGGAGFTQATGARVHSGGGTTGFADIYTQVPAAATGAQTLSITNNGGSGNSYDEIAWAVSVLGGFTLGAVKTVSGSGVSSQTLTWSGADALASGDLILAICVNGTSAPTVTTGTSIASQVGGTGASSHNAVIAQNTGTGTVSVVFSTNAADSSAACGIRLIATGGAAAEGNFEFGPGRFDDVIPGEIRPYEVATPDFSLFWFDAGAAVIAAADVPPNPLLEQLVEAARRFDYESDQQTDRLVDTSYTQSVDAPLPEPPGQLPQIEWLRRRHDYEVEQQARHLLDISVTQSVDAPIPQPLVTVEWLRRRPDFEAEQQPRKLTDTSVTASVDSPTAIPPVAPPVRPRWNYTTRPGLPVDILAPAVVADNPTGAPYAQWVGRAPAWEQWSQAEKLHPDVMASVDAPIPNAFPPQLELRYRWNYPVAHGLPVDVLAPVVTPDNPTGAPFTQWIPRPPAWEPWTQARKLDVSVTQSVDAPPGFFVQQPARRDQTLTQWHQAAPGLISAPADLLPPQLQAAAYLRTAAATQAYQKQQSVLFLITVESPPTQGPFQPAIYRRPVPPTPYRIPSTVVLVAPPVLELVGVSTGTITSATSAGGIVSMTSTGPPGAATSTGGPSAATSSDDGITSGTSDGSIE
jgi:hypothetical protein